MRGAQTAKWLLIVFGLVATGVVLAGAGFMAWLWHSLSGLQIK